MGDSDSLITKSRDLKEMLTLNFKNWFGDLIHLISQIISDTVQRFL